MRNVDIIFIDLKLEQLKDIIRTLTEKEVEQLADDVAEFTKKMIKKYK